MSVSWHPEAWSEECSADYLTTSLGLGAEKSISRGADPRS